MVSVFERWGLATGEGKVKLGQAVALTILSLTTTLTVATAAGCPCMLWREEGKAYVGDRESYDAVAANSAEVDLSDVVERERSAFRSDVPWL